MRRRIALIPSPFVGANSWAPVAGLSPEFVAMDYGGVRAPDWCGAVAAKIVEQVGRALDRRVAQRRPGAWRG
jgi:hypothetical protein